MVRSSFILVFGLMSGGSAYAYDIGAYAVANHRPCGSSNLPATVTELERFFRAENFPVDARQNFFWTNSAVKADDWKRDTDSRESTETQNGQDGVDASLISYIASHGMTSGGRYTGSAGTSSNGGCSIRSSDMTIGDQWLRYLVLSTCQGLKIGSGSNPTRPGEDPSRTWQNTASAMNCIYGYSNNMVDASGYGEYWLNNIASGTESLAESFLRAGRQVSYSNIPAVLCFGIDENNARYNLENHTAFTDSRIGGETSAWVYRNSSAISSTFAPTAKAFVPELRVAVPDLSKRSIEASFAALGGKINIDERNGVISWSRSNDAQFQDMKLSDREVIERGESFLVENGYDVKSLSLVPTYIINKGTKLDGNVIVVEKMVVFHQSVAGLSPLSTAGSVEVNVNANGDVTMTHIALRKFVAAEPVKKALTSARLVALEAKAFANMAERFPEATLNLENARIGYDLGSYYEAATKTRAVVEFEIAVTQGAFTRVHVERLAL